MATKEGRGDDKDISQPGFEIWGACCTSRLAPPELEIQNTPSTTHHRDSGGNLRITEIPSSHQLKFRNFTFPLPCTCAPLRPGGAYLAGGLSPFASEGLAMASSATQAVGTGRPIIGVAVMTSKARMVSTERIIAPIAK